MPFRIAASDNGEPSVGSKMFLNMFTSLRFRDDHPLYADSIGHPPVGIKSVVMQRVGIPEHLAESGLLAFLESPVAQVDDRDRSVIPHFRVIAGIKARLPSSQ